MTQDEAPQHEVQESPPEKKRDLLLLAAGPSVWMLHFLLSYGAAALWCGMVAGRNGSLSGARGIIAVMTVIALGVIGFIGWEGWRRHTYGTAALPHDFDTPEDRHRFLGFATLLLASLSAVATMYVAATAVLIGTCY